MAHRPFHVYAFLYPILTGMTWTRVWIEHHVRTFAREGWKWTLPEDLDLGRAFIRAADAEWTAPGGGREKLSGQIVEAVRRAHQSQPVDLFYAYVTAGHISPGAVRAIRDMRIPTVLLSCDNLGSFENVEEIAPHFDCVWYCESEAAKKFDRIGAAGLYLPLAADPDYCVPAIGVEEKHDVVFMGALAGSRGRWLGPLIDAGFDVVHRGFQPDFDPPLRRLWHIASRLRHGDFAGAAEEWEYAGIQWRWGKALADRNRPSVPDAEVNRVYQEARVSLGMNEAMSWDASDRSRRCVRYLKLRDFEAPMAGACYLTGDCPDLRACYEVGKEVAAYSCREELIEQAGRLIRDEALRKRMRRSAREAALSRHTYRHRFQRIFEFLGIPWPKTSQRQPAP